MKKENNAHKANDPYITTTRVKKAVDLLLLVMKKPVLSEFARSSSSLDNVPDTEFLDTKKLKQRIKKHEKEWAKYFKDCKKKFNKAYSRLQGGIFNFRKKELTWEEREDALKEIFDVEELRRLYYEQLLDEEMDASFRDTAGKTAKKLGVEIDTKTISVPVNAMNAYKQFALRLTKTMSVNADQKIQNIVIFGMENGLSTAKIAKEINEKFDYFTKKEAMRIARTETIRASAKGSIAAYEYLGVEYYEILPSFNACPICQDLASGNPYKLGDIKAIPPIHPSCLCTVIPVLQKK